MEAAKTYLIEFWQSDMVQDIIHSAISFLLSFVDMGIVHDEVFIIIFAILIFIGFFFLLSIFTKGLTRGISIFFAFLMMIGAVTIYASVVTGLLQVKFDEEKLQARAEIERKKAEQNRPPDIPPAVPQFPLTGSTPVPTSSQASSSGNFGLPESEKIHWEIYDPYEKPQALSKENTKQASANIDKSKPQSQINQAPATNESAEKKAQRAQIGAQLAQIEQELSYNITYIDDHLLELDNKVKSGEINEMSALAQKARWGIEKQNMILESMDEKVAVLMNADLLADTDKANDLRVINERRQAANERITQYQNVLQQLEENKEVLQSLW